jgi:serine/threonine protein kinase
MGSLSDETIRHLRTLADWPEVPGDRYRIVEQIGRGGMGGVYLAEDLALQREVAIKVLSLPNLDDASRERMLREAHILGQLEHPGIVPIHDVGFLDDGRVFYAMKLVRGIRLDAFVSEARPMRERLRVFLRACEAVAFAHSHGIIHRDLKPENIMVGPFGEVLVLDWGVAKRLPSPARAVDRFASRSQSGESASAQSVGDASASRMSVEEQDGESTRDDGLNTANALLGTPGYMSPEQERGDADRLDERTDVYGLGALLRFLSVAHPLPSDAGLSVRRLEAVCAKATSDNPDDRYPSVLDLAADVARLLEGNPLIAYREGPLEKAGRFVRRHQLPILLVLAYLFMRALLLLFAD